MDSTLCRLCFIHKNSSPNFECNKVDIQFLIHKFLDIKISTEDASQNVCCNCLSMLINFHRFYQICNENQKIFIVNINDETKTENQNSSPLHSNQMQLQSSDNKMEVSENSLSHDNNGATELSKKENQAIDSRMYKTDDMVHETIASTYTCDICQKHFFTFFDYQDHQETHDGEEVFKCSKCQEIFNKRKILVEHESRHKTACKICKLEVLPKSMSAHLLMHTDMFKCPQCGTRHPSKANLELHVKAKHAGLKGFVCYICGKQSSCHSSMTRHMAYHSHLRPHKCKFCDFTAKSSGILQVHTSRRHLGEKCVCDLCAKVFSSQPSLQQHTKRMHGSRKHRCEMCGKAFSELFCLRRHLKKHAGQIVYECRICRREFFTTRKLKEHMHSHRQGCVSCIKCGRTFFYKKNLNKHMQKCGADCTNNKMKNKTYYGLVS